MKNKLFITLALLAGASYAVARHNDHPKVDEWGYDANQDQTWGLNGDENDNPNVDEWGYDKNRDKTWGPNNRRMQAQSTIAQDDDSDVIGDMTGGVDVPGVDDEWGWDQ